MDINEFKDKLVAGTLTRREINKTLATAGIAMLSAPIASGTAAAAEGEAIYFTWSGEDLPEFYKSYVEKHGALPEFVFGSGEEERFQKARAGFQADVGYSCAPLVHQWRDAGLIQPIDTSRLSNWPDVFPALKSLQGSQFDGEQFLIPTEWGRTSITYRTDLVDWEGEDSWALLWDERYKGQLAVFDLVDETVFITAIYAGVDPCNMSDADLDKVMGLLEQQKPLLRFYATDETSVTQALAAGEVVAALTWDSGAAELMAEGIPVKFMIPKEGVETWACGLILMKDAPHLDKAYDLMDSLLSVETGEALISGYGYGHSNMRAFENVSEDVLTRLQLPRDPTELLESGVMFCAFKDKNKVIQRFEDMKAGF
jgi:spermidine/putrescine transport system substrate-binding protein